MKAYMRAEWGDTLSWVGGELLYPRVEGPPLLQVNSVCVHRDEIGEIVSSILCEGLSETSNNQALLILKMKVYMRVEGGGGGHFTPG